ncbi:alpha-amylase family glycosyl hydrolase [Egicoccus sp. AB-alg6-2]|uniref:alpha-amylase family glycosyl hydrolase n=1 Tax=Egicoccus sp. AB-alg6-2 TaxID=3242692 RepID=UPI00359EF885
MRPVARGIATGDVGELLQTGMPMRGRRRVPVATLVLLLVATAVLLVTARPVAETPSMAASGAWPQDAVIYHVFVDRFAEGGPAGGGNSDAGAGDGGAADGGAADGGAADGGAADGGAAGEPSPNHDAALMDWMGGDLAGVRQRLDHVVELGANTLWLSPVTPGPGYHGYHPTDLTDVDPRFGDRDELVALVREAHARGVKVIYDLVLNHTSDQHPWFVAARADCDGSPYVAWYEFRDCPDRYAGFAGLAELPELDLDHPEVRAWVFDEVLPFWLDEIGVDGFRLDHAQGPSRAFWDAFRAEVDARWPGTFLLGEIWAQQTIIDSYGDVMDAATAFPLRDRLVAVVARGGDVRALHQPIVSLLEGDGPRPATYVSSHDQPRFLTEAGGDRERLALAYAALLTLPGVPVVYYGDEVGLGQSGDHRAVDTHQDRYFREPMSWDTSTWDLEVLDRVSRLARLRTTRPALYAGEYVPLVTEGDALVFERVTDDGERVLVVLATGNDAVSIDLTDLYGTEAAAELLLTDLLAGERAPAEVAAGELVVDPRGVGVWQLTGS